MKRKFKVFCRYLLGFALLTAGGYVVTDQNYKDGVYDATNGRL